VPAPIAPLVGFAFGVILAWAGRREPARDFYARPFDGRAAIVVAYAALVFAPVNAYFLAFAGDWSFAYFFDSRALPSAVALLVVLFDAAVVWAGFVAGRWVRQARSAGVGAVLAGAPLLLAAVAVLLAHGRLRADATFDQIRSNFGVTPIASSPLGIAIVWMNLLLVLGLVITAKALNRGFFLPRAAEGTHALPASTRDSPGGSPRRLGSGSALGRSHKEPGSATPD
jgi:hypothetical protein